MSPGDFGGGEQRDRGRYAAGLEAGDAFGRQLAVVAHAARGEAAQVRDEPVTYFTNQDSSMAYHRFRAVGWDFGSGMIERGSTTAIGQREKGAGTRWSDAGTQTVANVRLLLFSDEWSALWAAA